VARRDEIATGLSVAVLAAVAGRCGGDGDEKHKIVDVLKETRDAVLAGDGCRACG